MLSKPYMLYRSAIFLIIYLTTLIASGQKKVFNITDYGAVANAVSPNTKAIQQAIDECTISGGGVVLVPKITDNAAIYLTGTIILKNNVELFIDSGAVLSGSTNYNDYKEIEPFTDAVGQSRGACLIGASGAGHIAITGKGSIDGQGGKWKNNNNPDYARRPFLLRIVKTDHCLLRDIHFTNSAAWMCNFDLCKNISIEHININNRVNANNDGIDIDACQNVEIKNCTINSSDDAICFKTTRGTSPCQHVTVLNNDLTSSCGGIKWGTESMGDFKDFTIKGNYIHDTNLAGIKILSADGANISDITITNTRMQNVYVPVFICIKNRLKTYHDFPKRTVGSISNIKIDKLIATDCRTAGILITGIPKKYIGPGIWFKDIDLSGLGSNAMLADAGKIPPENEDAYPEVNRFGTLPAYGAYIRHVKGISFTNLNISKKLPDQRYAIVFDDTDDNNNTLVNFKAQSDEHGLPSVHKQNTIEKK